MRADSAAARERNASPHRPAQAVNSASASAESSGTVAPPRQAVRESPPGSVENSDPASASSEEKCSAAQHSSEPRFVARRVVGEQPEASLRTAPRSGRPPNAALPHRRASPRCGSVPAARANYLDALQGSARSAAETPPRCPARPAVPLPAPADIAPAHCVDRAEPLPGNRRSLPRNSRARFPVRPNRRRFARYAAAECGTGPAFASPARSCVAAAPKFPSLPRPLVLREPAASPAQTSSLRAHRCPLPSPPNLHKTPARTGCTPPLAASAAPSGSPTACPASTPTAHPQSAARPRAGRAVADSRKDQKRWGLSPNARPCPPYSTPASAVFHLSMGNDLRHFFIAIIRGLPICSPLARGDKSPGVFAECPPAKGPHSAGFMMYRGDRNGLALTVQNRGPSPSPA